MIYPKDVEVNELSVHLALALGDGNPEVKPKMEHEDTSSTLAEPLTSDDHDDHDGETSQAAAAKKPKRVLTRRDLCTN